MKGDCADCHTMHNSEQGAAVAIMGLADTKTNTPIQNLLRMDCIACHAADPTGGEKIWAKGDSLIPQVMHGDATGDLAGGNFKYIRDSGDRKGHNVVDLVSADQALRSPPGFPKMGGITDAFDATKFTCAGSMGCHGFRGQVLTSSTVTCDEWGNNTETGLPCTAQELEVSGVAQLTYRTGLSALSGFDAPVGQTTALKMGAHHQSYDGVKTDGSNPNFFNSPLAHSYRFIRGLRGYGNEAERWQNTSSSSHNEYIGGYENTAMGDLLKNTNFETTAACARCHVGSSVNDTNSRMTVPGGTMSGFCITCHSRFHSSGVTNGTSGAFLRHPSDWIIPDKGEYQAFTAYNINAPVARQHAFLDAGPGNVAPSATVTPGQDMVMCMSCHMAHASQYDGMLRFDYAQQTAGNATEVGMATGCLACHTTKGVLPQNR